MTGSSREIATNRINPAEPIIPGFHPDPSVCRVGEDYYLACLSFEYFPGVPIFHSRNLVGWTQIGNALDRSSQLRPIAAASSAGIYTPTLRHHDGRFWLVATNVSIRAHILATADDPAGPWSGLAYPEAPHLYHVNGLWYLVIAEGGTERGYAVPWRGPNP